MFNLARKGKSASVQEKLASVETFNALVRERTELRSKQAALASSLERAEARIAAIPGAEQGIHDDHFRNVVQRECDASRPDLTESHNKKLSDLKAEQGELKGLIMAYRQELESIHRTLAPMDGEYGSIGRARCAAWEAVADNLIEQISGEFPKQFLRTWVAMDRVRDGVHVTAVLSKIVPTELGHESKLKTIDELRDEFGILSEYE